MAGSTGERDLTMQNHNERAHALLSASSAHRWLACPPSARLAANYPAQDTKFTREGTLAHEVAESIARERIMNERPTVVWDQLDDVTPEMVACGMAYADYIEERIKTRHAIVRLEERVDYSYWAPEGFGTCDCCILQDGHLTIIDYKYGKGVEVTAKDNPQMMLYALGAIEAFGFMCEIKTVEMHVFQPRINNISWHEMSADDLREWGKTVVKPVARKAIRGAGTYAAGEHCRFCPHAGRCRTLTKTCTDLVGEGPTAAKVPVMAPWEVAEVLKMEPLITLWLKRVKAQALETMMNGGDVPGYKIVAGKEGNRKWSDELKVLGALEAAGYGREDVTETKLLSPAGMDKAIGKKKVAELLTDHITRAPGAPTVVPQTDRRPAYDRAAEIKKDFE